MAFWGRKRVEDTMLRCPVLVLDSVAYWSNACAGEDEPR